MIKQSFFTVFVLTNTLRGVNFHQAPVTTNQQRICAKTWVTWGRTKTVLRNFEHRAIAASGRREAKLDIHLILV